MYVHHKALMLGAPKWRVAGLLERDEAQDEANYEDTDSARILVPDFKWLPLQKKEAVKLKIYQLLNDRDCLALYFCHSW